MSYESDKRAEQLTESTVITDFDWMFIQKDGSSSATKIPVALMSAYVSGVEYRSYYKSLTPGNNLVEFASAMPDTDYEIFFYTRDSENYDVGGEVVEGSETVNGFTINVPAACTLKYFAIQNR